MVPELSITPILHKHFVLVALEVRRHLGNEESCGMIFFLETKSTTLTTPCQKRGVAGLQFALSSLL